VVESVVINAIVLSMVSRCQHSHLVSVYRVKTEESLYFVGNHFRLQVSPLSTQFDEHCHRSTLLSLPQPSKLVELLVGHLHLFFIKLH